VSQAHASAAVVNFSEGCDSEVMRPHLDTLIGETHRPGRGGGGDEALQRGWGREFKGPSL